MPAGLVLGTVEQAREHATRQLATQLLRYREDYVAHGVSQASATCLISEAAVSAWVSYLLTLGLSREICADLLDETAEQLRQGAA